MTEQPDRLVRSGACRRERPREGAQHRLVAGEAAAYANRSGRYACSPAPIRIRGACAARMPKVERPRKPISGKAGTRPGAMRFQGGTRTGSTAGPNSRSSASQPVPSSPSTIMAGRCGAELGLLFAGRGMVGMGVAVLQQIDAGSPARDARPAPASRLPGRSRAPAARRGCAAASAGGRAPAWRRPHRRRATTGSACGRHRASAPVPRRSRPRRSCAAFDATSAAVAAAPLRSQGGKLRIDGPRRARSTAAASAVGRQLSAGRHDDQMPRSASQRRAIGLLGLARRAERAPARRDRRRHRVSTTVL